MSQTLAAITPLTPDPLVTFYDRATGERTELSGITLSNWVAKVSNFLVDDLEVEIGTRLRLGLGPHWLTHIWLLSCWNTGVIVTDAEADIGLSGPDLVADEPTKLASALAPFGMRFPQNPEGFIDIGVEVLGHSDHFEAFDSPLPTDVAWDLGGQTTTHAEARSRWDSGEPKRLLLQETTLLDDTQLLVNAILSGGSLVVVRHASEADVIAIATQEQADIRG